MNEKISSSLACFELATAFSFKQKSSRYKKRKLWEVILHFYKAYEFIIPSSMQMIVGAYEYSNRNARGLINFI